MKKRFLALLLTLVMALGLTAPAFALEWSYGLFDAGGKAVTELEYDSFGYFSEGLIAVEQNGKWGFMDEKGKMVIEPAYDSVKDFSGGLAAVATGRWTSQGGESLFTGKWGFIDKTGKVVVELKYDAVGEILTGTDGKTWIAVVGKSAGEGEYGETVYSYGLIDKTGKELLPLEYRSIRNIPGEADLLEVVKGASYEDEKRGVADFSGKVIIPVAYNEIRTLENNDNSLLLASVRGEDYSSTYTLFDSTGKKLLDGYSSIEKLADGLLKVCKGSYPDTKYGVADLTGKVIVPVEYSGVSLVEDKLIQVQQGDYSNRTYGVYDLTGKVIFPAQYYRISYAKDSGVFTVQEKNDGKSAYYKENGTQITPPAGYAFGGGSAGAHDSGWGKTSVFSDGLILVSETEHGSKYSYMNTNGTIVYSLPTQVMSKNMSVKGGGFSDGLAPVGFEVPEPSADGKMTTYPTRIGYIDKTGRTVIAAQYSKGMEFENGLAKVAMKNEKNVELWGVIDTTGKVVVPLEYGNKSWLEILDSGMVQVNKDGKYGLYNQEGKLVVPAEYSNASDITVGGGSGYGSIPEGFIQVRKDYQHNGLLTVDGKVILPAEYSNISFVDENGSGYGSEEYAAICANRTVDGKYVTEYFTLAGKPILAKRYDQVQLTNGLLRVGTLTGEDDWTCRYGLFALTGAQVLSVEYDSISVYGNVIFAEKNGKYGAFDRTGKALMPMEYDDISMSNANNFFTAGTQQKPATAEELGLTVTGWAQAEVDDALAAGLYDEALGKNMVENITRAQAAAVAVKLYEAMNGEEMPEKENPFTDTEDPNVIKAYSLGLIDGNGSGKFGPDDPLNREAVAVMLAKVYRKLGGTIPAASATTFADDGKISGWAKAEVSFMAEKGIVKGDGTSFNPQGAITGQEALILGLHMMNTLG